MRNFKSIITVIIFFFTPLMILGNELSIIKLRTKSVQYIVQDKNDTWGNISEPSNINFLIEIDMNLSRIKLYRDLEPDIFDIVRISKKIVLNSTIMELYCTDVDGLKCIITNMKLDDGNIIFCIEYNDVKVIYNALLLN